jgi:hypothetical protein
VVKLKTNEEHLQIIERLMNLLGGSRDFFYLEKKFSNNTFRILYLKPLVDEKVLHRDLLPYLTDPKLETLENVKNSIPIEAQDILENYDEVKTRVMNGYVLIQLAERSDECLLVNARANKSRQVAPPEVEFSVVGPKEAFIESLDTNLHLVRKRLPIDNLQAIELSVGNVTKTRVVVLYIQGIANEENVNTVIQRISNVQIDQVIDSSYITQLISDNYNSVFPQLIDTERPDRIAAVLVEGKVSILVDGSPHALIGPVTLIEFFSAFEDYFLNSIIASIFRLIRLFAVMFSILVTPIYVGVLTHHFELIPKDLMNTLISSRAQVPLPPILEAVLLELTIELLREAGARLPTKVGQTIGIVGGIVIGTASVEAGLTSNVLLIIVALAALASFTTPVYQMGNTIRLIRFPFLLLAHVWGLLGIVLSFIYLLTHLLRLTSLGRPFLEPLYPLRYKDLKDAFIRLPLKLQSKRPEEVQPKDKKRFAKSKGKTGNQ